MVMNNDPMQRNPSLVEHGELLAGLAKKNKQSIGKSKGHNAMPGEYKDLKIEQIPSDLGVRDKQVTGLDPTNIKNLKI